MQVMSGWEKMRSPKKTNRYSDEYKIKPVCLVVQPDILATEIVVKYDVQSYNSEPNAIRFIICTNY